MTRHRFVDFEVHNSTTILRWCAESLTIGIECFWSVSFPSNKFHRRFVLAKLAEQSLFSLVNKMLLLKDFSLATCILNSKYLIVEFLNILLGSICEYIPLKLNLKFDYIQWSLVIAISNTLYELHCSQFVLGMRSTWNEHCGFRLTFYEHVVVSTNERTRGERQNSRCHSIWVNSMATTLCNPVLYV